MHRFLPIAALAIAGCAAPARAPAPAPAAPAAESGIAALPFERWDVTSGRLEIRIYRDGPMQRLGHNHVIVSEGLRGIVKLREPLLQSGFALELPLASLEVDDPAARAEAGAEFATPVPPKDREATRRNMLGDDVLASARQDVLRLAADGIAGTPAAYATRVRVSFRGEEHAVTVPFTVEREGDTLRARSDFRLMHGHLGLAPFNVGLGALRVRDDIGFLLRLEARRAS
jgi:hypothetical protein